MTARLGDYISDARSGFASGEQDTVGVFQVRMNNLTRDGSWDLTKRRRVPATPRQIATYALEPGDVLFNATNSPELVGKTALLLRRDEPMVFSNHFVRLRVARDRLDPAFLSRWLQMQFDRRVFQGMCRQWVNQATVGRDALLNLTIPVPPLDEQRRIADILDRADALRVKRREALGLLDELAGSIFLDMFGNEGRRAVTPHASGIHPAGWTWVPLTDVAQLATGHTPDRKRADYWDGEIPWISLPEIRGLDGKTAVDTELRVTALGVANSSAVVLPVGTICFSRTASIGFVTKLGRPMATSQDFHNWIPGADLDPEYLMSALRVSREHLLGASDGSTHKTIYQRIAANFRILLPPFDLQQRFAARLHGVDAVRRSGSEQAVIADDLFTALQQRAFHGQL